MYSRTLARKLVQLVVHQLPAVSCRWCDALSPAVVAQGAAAAAGGAAHAQGAGAGAAQKVSAAAAAPKVCTPVRSHGSWCNSWCTNFRGVVPVV